MAKILLVDDDELVRYALSRLLQKAGHDVIEVDNPKKVLDLIQKNQPDLLITDIVMPEKDGIELINEVRESNPFLPIFAISGGGKIDGEVYLDIVDMMGADATMSKPFDNDAFILQVEKLIAARNT